jgi:hypothetical protein
MQPAWLHLEPGLSLSCSCLACSPLEPFRCFARPSKGWSVNILPVRSTAVPLPRNEMEDHALFACVTGAATGIGRVF